MWRQAAEEAVRAAIRAVRGALNSGSAARPLRRGAGGDVTRVVDQVAEEAVLRVLQRRGLRFTLVSEEQGVVSYGSESVVVALDPLDGTGNALRGIPPYAVALGVAFGRAFGDVRIAVVGDVVSGELFIAAPDVAVCGRGALRTSGVTRLRKAVASVDLTRYPLARDRGLLRLLTSVRRVRHYGSNALEIAWVAAGRLDLFVDVRGVLRDVDLAAACFLVRAAGGAVWVDPDESTELGLRRYRIVAAATPALLREALRVLRLSPGPAREG